METIIGLIVFGSIGFWLAATALSFLVVVLIANDEGMWASAMVLAFLTLLVASGLLTLSPLSIALAIVGYLVTGVAWSVFKWYLLLMERKRQYNEYVNKIDADDDGPDSMAKTIRRKRLIESKYNIGEHSHQNKSVIPSASKNKDKIIGWMVAWPWSALWTLLNDPFQYLYRTLRAQYQRMADRVFADIGTDTKV